MNPDIDELVRDAVRRQEELAVDPERVRAVLPERAARRARQRRTWTLTTVAAAAAVAVAVIVPVVVLPEPGTGPASTPTAPSVPEAGALLGYRPTWLPPGLAERSRSIPGTDAPEATTGRIWTATPLLDGFDTRSKHLGLYAFRSAPDGADPQHETRQPPVIADQGETPAQPEHTEFTVDINGKPGRYDNATVTWQVDADTKLILVAPELDLPKADLLKIARSVRPDTTRQRPPLDVGWLPDGFVEQYLTVTGNSPSEWEAKLFTEDSAHRYLSVHVGTAAPRTGEPLTVADRPATLVTANGDTSIQSGYRTDWLLAVDLGDGSQLTVTSGSREDVASEAPLSQEALVRAAEHAVLDPNPDVDWLAH